VSSSGDRADGGGDGERRKKKIPGIVVSPPEPSLYPFTPQSRRAGTGEAARAIRRSPIRRGLGDSQRHPRSRLSIHVNKLTICAPLSALSHLSRSCADLAYPSPIEQRGLWEGARERGRKAESDVVQACEYDHYTPVDLYTMQRRHSCSYLFFHRPGSQLRTAAAVFPPRPNRECQRHPRTGSQAHDVYKLNTFAKIRSRQSKKAK
jgi:hypothetical protein